MEELMAKLHTYGHFLELEEQIPYWEQQVPEMKMRIRELESNRSRKEYDLRALETPNFFQKLFGRVEEKKERLNRQVSEVTAALNAALWELTDLEKKIAAAKQELEALWDSREIYEQAKQNAALSMAEESQLMMEELAAFLPAALSAADRVLGALGDAHFWMQEDAHKRGVSQDNRKLECLDQATEYARRLCSVLKRMPEGVASVGGYLLDPDSYILCVSSELEQLDRLNFAISQVQETRNQLSMLQ